MNGAGPVSSAPSAECPSSMSLQTSQSMPVQSHLQMVLQGVSRNSYQAGVAAQPHYAAPSAHHPYNNQGYGTPDNTIALSYIVNSSTKL